MNSYLLIDFYETLENNRIPIPLYKGKKNLQNPQALGFIIESIL